MKNGQNKMDIIRDNNRIEHYIGYVSYTTQTVYYFYLSAILIVGYFIITFLMRARKKWKYFRVVKGDFGLKEDIDVNGSSIKNFQTFLKNQITTPS